MSDANVGPLSTQTEVWLFGNAPLCLPAHRLVERLVAAQADVQAATELMPARRREEVGKAYAELVWYARTNYAGCLGAEVDRCDEETRHARAALTAAGITDSQVRLVEDRAAAAQARRDRLMQLAHEALP